ncbi:histidine phosphatase family protein [Kitasatospora sp. NPDC050467]|uniref:histidine phosphatase family protein n=1 Tax=unclassified Kitasatospora TaxID=2633591 RepID=UPI0037A357FE
MSVPSDAGSSLHLSFGNDPSREMAVSWATAASVSRPRLRLGTAKGGHGGDTGIREQLLPVFDRYQVDPVLCGHDHDYERTYAVRGTDLGSLLRPSVVSDEIHGLDTSQGTVHLIPGGGGTASNDDTYLTDPAGTGVPDAFVRTQRLTFKADADAKEKATWSAVRDPDTAFPYGVAVLDVDPGSLIGRRTTITVSSYHTPAATTANPARPRCCSTASPSTACGVTPGPLTTATWLPQVADETRTVRRGRSAGHLPAGHPQRCRRDARRGPGWVAVRGAGRWGVDRRVASAAMLPRERGGAHCRPWWCCAGGPVQPMRFSGRADRLGGMRMEVSRRLMVLRHAKSAWPDDVADRDRPLGPRGLRDAPVAGRWLQAAGCLPDAVVCSPARRTRQTWELVAGELSTAPAVTYDERLYGASASVLLAVVHEAPDHVRSLLLVGHFPGVQELPLALAGDALGDARERMASKFPTSGLALLTLSGPWTQADAGSAVLTDFVVPRGQKP